MEITKEIVLDILRKITPYGDNYCCGEDDTEVWASYSNDYPMQHGDGWSFKVNKNDLFITLATKKLKKNYSKLIENELNKLK